MPRSGADDDTSCPPRHARRTRDHRVLRGIAFAGTATLLFGVASAVALLQRLSSNIDYIDVAGLMGGTPSSTLPAGATAAGPTTDPDPVDPSGGRAVNILVLGSDQRDGANADIGGEATTMASDTKIVVHISADRSRVELVSIPRDSLVDIPACQASNGTWTEPADDEMFNRAFAFGWEAGGDLASAAACAGRTVQQNTGLTIDHFVVVDFVGLQSMVDAIDGVEICIPEHMYDTQIPLDLQPGMQTLRGYDALQFARSRHNNLGDGSDLARIGNQQRLLAALVNQVLSRDVLTNPVKLTGFLSAATSSLTVDNGLTLATMTGLAYSARSVRSGDIVFMTIPVADSAQEWGRVVWTSKATSVWANMAADQPIAPDAAPPAAPQTTAGTTAEPAPGEDPEQPVPGQTRRAGREPFTGADTTAVCTG